MVGFRAACLPRQLPVMQKQGSRDVSHGASDHHFQLAISMNGMVGVGSPGVTWLGDKMLIVKSLIAHFTRRPSEAPPRRSFYANLGEW